MATLEALTNYGEDLEPNSMDIRTEYLEPITSSTYKYTFRLDQSGYLDTNSMLTFKLLANNDANTLRPNCWNGVLGSIKRVIFQVGDNIINDIQDVYKYSTLKNMNMPPSMRNGYLGHYLGNQLWTDVVEDGAETYKQHNLAKEAVDKSTVGSVYMDGDRSGQLMGLANGTGSASINSHRIGTDVSTNPQYGITLGMLIPALRGQKIPLFLFDRQRILLTFEFNTSDKYVVSSLNAKNDWVNQSNGGTGYGIADATDVVPASVQMVVDYIIMPSDVQNQVLAQTQKQGGYRLEFYDVVNVEKNVPAGTDGVEQLVEHRIGQNNREVHNIYMWKEANDKNDFSKHPKTVVQNSGSKQLFGLLGHQICRGIASEEMNCNIDGRDEFDHFVFSPVAQYNELKACLGSDLRVDRPMYCNDDNTQASELATMESGLSGVFKPLALSLRNGEMGVVGAGRVIGQYPIVWKYKRKCAEVKAGAPNVVGCGQALKVNYFIEVSRSANILNTGAGMSVMVSY